jgi:hypothetical protein
MLTTFTSTPVPPVVVGDADVATRDEIGEETYMVHKRAACGEWLRGVGTRRERRGNGRVAVDGFGLRIFGKRIA